MSEILGRKVILHRPLFTGFVKVKKKDRNNTFLIKKIYELHLNDRIIKNI